MCALAATAVAVLAACGSAPTPRDDDAACALARHRQWVGAAAWDAMRDITLEGTMAVSSMQGAVSVLMTRDGLARETYDFGAVRGGEGLDAAGAWRLNQSGQLEGLGDDDVRELRSQIAQAFGEHLRGTAGARATHAGRQRFGDQECDVVRLAGDPAIDAAGNAVKGAASAAVELFLAADGALVATRTRAGERTREVTFGDWRVVDGVRIPHRQTTTGDNEPQTVTWTRVQLNRGLAAKDLARPTPARASASTGATALEIPIDLHLDRYAYVRGEVNGTATDVVLDSGAGITVVDRALADKIGLRGAGDVKATGVGGEKRSVQLAKATVRIGELELPDLTVAILDLGEVHARLGRAMPVILGKELLHAYTVTFDYPKRRLLVRDSASFTAPVDAIACEVRPVDDGHVMLQIEFEDLGPGWFMVDTGAGDTLALHAGYVEKHGLLQRYPRFGERRIGGVGGTLPAKTATAGTIKLAGHTFRDVPVTLATERKGAFGSSKCDGNLGAELMGRFVVTFDYARKRLLFQPGPTLSAPFTKDRSGLVLDRQGDTVTVIAVTAGSPAAAAGFAVGDTITAIDGTALDPSKAADVIRKTLRQPSGTVLRLRDGTGRERAVTLADYY